MSERLMGLNWISSTGGPLMLLSEERLSDWKGFSMGGGGWDDEEELDEDDDEPDEGESDYDRACSVEGYLGALEVGSGKGLVLGDEPHLTTIYKDADALMIVRLVTADDPAACAELKLALGAMETLAVDIPPVELELGAGFMMLFDAASPGGSARDEGDVLELEVPAGTYAFRTSRVSGDGIQLLVHRGTPG